MSKEYPWFRLYHEIIDDDKVRLLAFEDRWHYVALLACKAKGLLDDEQSFDLLQRRLAVRLGLQVRELEALQRRLMEVDLVDGDWQPCGWDKRQYASDHSAAERKRRQRERQRQQKGDSKASQEDEPLSHDEVTGQSRDSHCLDTDTEEEASARARARHTPSESSEGDEPADSGSPEAQQQGALVPDHPEQEAPAQSEAGKKAKRATQILDDFQPEPNIHQWAQSETPLVDVQREVGKFVDHHRSKGNTFKDHQRAFKNWLRNAQRFAERDQQRDQHHGQQEPARRSRKEFKL